MRPLEPVGPSAPGVLVAPSSLADALEPWLREQEKHYLTEQLELASGNVTLTAKACGIGLRTLSRKLQLHGLDHRFFRKKARMSVSPPQPGARFLSV